MIFLRHAVVDPLAVRIQNACLKPIDNPDPSG
jgi:hypothetical protein